MRWLVTFILVVQFTQLAFGADELPAPQAPRLPLFNLNVGRGDWPQLAGNPYRNHVSDGPGVPIEWDIESGKNIKWTARLGTRTYGTPVIANGKMYVGTNNAAGYLKRSSSRVDLSALLCFREADGEFLWQHSNQKLPTGLVHDYPMQGIHSSPVVEGDRLWYVTTRGEVVCLDTEGFRDHENDGPFGSERPANDRIDWEESHEADIVWSFDMMNILGTRQLHRATCSPTIWGGLLFVCTSNGVDASEDRIANPDAPSFIALDKHSGEVVWTDNSPGSNILQGQWSSPSVGVFDGVPQVLFAGGDGWLYSFRADRWNEGKPELLWKFDGNPKDAVHLLYGLGRRNGIEASPVIYDGRVYLAMGQDPDHGDGPGDLWCIDPTRRGDVSPQLVVDQNGNLVPHQRKQATAPSDTVKPSAIPNPNSAVIWHFDSDDTNHNGKIDFEEIMHRTVGSPVIKNDLLFAADFAGVVHCMNARTGKPHWACDVFSSTWATPLIAGEFVYVTDENGDVSIFSLSSDPAKSVTEEQINVNGPFHESLRKVPMIHSIYAAPVVANQTLYLTTNRGLYAISLGAKETRSRLHPD